MRVLLLSAYAAGSHTHWRRCLLEMLRDWEWVVLELPPRHFSWRIRGNPLYWSQVQRTRLQERYDLLLATSMVDLATLRGLVPELSGLPTALYFHENQFDYPAGEGKHGLLEAQMVSLYAALASDGLLFNSRYNQQGFVDGCATLLKRLPDLVPEGVPERLALKSRVLPVPVDVEQMNSGLTQWPGTSTQQSLRLLWTGRFEYDKGGDRLLKVLRALEATTVDYELAMVGQQFRSSPSVFNSIAQEFEHRLVHFGYVDSREDYCALLRGAGIVLSTALHEFQGLAVLEAVAAGCLPIVPDRLAYSEIYPSSCRYASYLDDDEAEARAAVECLLAAWEGLRQARIERPAVSQFSLAAMAPRYRRELEGFVSTTG